MTFVTERKLLYPEIFESRNKKIVKEIPQEQINITLAKDCGERWTEGKNIEIHLSR